MSALLRAELLKQRTTRTTLQLPLWMAGLVGLVVLLHVFSLDVVTLSSRESRCWLRNRSTSSRAIAPVRRSAVRAAVKSFFRAYRLARVRPRVTAVTKPFCLAQ